MISQKLRKTARGERDTPHKGNIILHSSVVKRTLGKSHDFDCAFDYDLIGQILFDFRSHSHLTFLREVEVMTVTLVMTKVMTTFITRYLPLTFVFVLPLTASPVALVGRL